ncbi:MAG: hypothetical protein OSB21_11760 [Myxococcota bacterium]|nr:hypothetical protein [Myxococcota bacterium]
MSLAEQPIFNMMPRWDNGWGVQFEHEVEDSSGERMHLLHVEGVYTWQRWIRLTYKVPWLLSESALGNPVLALPLKKYFNNDGRSGSFSLTPEVSLPLSEVTLKLAGLSLGYSQETYRTTVDVSLAAHLQRKGLTFTRAVDELPLEWQLNFAAGGKYYPFDSVGNLRLSADFRYRPGGDYALRAGPVAYWRINDRWHVQASWKRTLAAQGFDSGNWIRSGLAVVF